MRLLPAAAALIATMPLLPCAPTSGQTLPPPNPFMGPRGTSTMHADAASSGVTSNCGPGSGSVTILTKSYQAVFPSILMSSDGLLVCVATKFSNQSPAVYLLDPTTLETLAEMNLPGSSTTDLAGGIYSYLDAQDRLVLVDADGTLLRIAHEQQADGTWTLPVVESVAIGYPDVVGIVPDYQGNVWFATFEGTAAGAGAVVGYHAPSSGETFSFTLPAGEMIANSISSSPLGVAIASTAAVSLFRAGDGGVEQVWRFEYDRGPARKPGQLSWGTGSTPAFFGAETGFEYLTITDNASPQENMLVLDAADGTLVGSAPFLTSGVNSGSENATLAVGNSLFLTSTYGYQYPPGAANGPSVPASAPFAGGMQRVDVLPKGAGLEIVWQNQDLASAALPRMSVRDGLIYTVTLDDAGMYAFVAIDAASGVVLSSTDIGSGTSNNTLQMVGTLGPSGVLYQGRERGLLSVTADTPPSCEPTCVDADFIADGHIDGADLALVLEQWGPATAKTVADLDGDGFVGPSDLGIVLSFWGTCE